VKEVTVADTTGNFFANWVCLWCAGQVVCHSSVIGPSAAGGAMVAFHDGFADQITQLSFSQSNGFCQHITGHVTYQSGDQVSVGPACSSATPPPGSEQSLFFFSHTSLTNGQC